MSSPRHTCWIAATLFLSSIMSAPAPAQEAVTYPGVGKDEHFLAAGPIPVVLTRYVSALERTNKIEANLLLLKQEGIIYQERDKSGVLKPAVRELSTRFDPILSVQLNVGKEKLTWTLDKKKKLFAGPVLPPAPIKVGATTFTKDEESKYLVFTYLQMQDALDNALQTNNQRTITATIEKAERFAKHAQATGLSVDAAGLFLKAKSLHDELKQITTARAEALKKLESNNKQFANELAAITAKNAARMNVESAGLLLGFLADSPQLAAQSYGGVTQSAANYLQQRTNVELAKKFADSAVAAELDAIAKRQEKAWDARDKYVKDVERKLSLPERQSIQDFAKEMEKSKDRTSAVKKLNVLAALYRKATPHGNPWLQEEIYYNESLIPYAATQKLQAAEKWLELAEKTVAEANKIPPGAAYDLDRFVILWRAAELAVRAAMLEVGDDRSLREFYSGSAAYALRVLEVAKKYNVIDIGAGMRELEVLAMALCDMPDDALELAAEISEARANSPLLHLYMSKIYASAPGDRKQTVPAAKESLVKAIKAGYGDFAAAKKNADLKKIIDTKFAYEHLTPILQVKVITPKSGFGKCDVQITNSSPMAVKDVNIVWFMPAPFMGMKAVEQFKIDNLGPRQMKLWQQTNFTYNRFDSSASLGNFVIVNRKDVRVEKVD